MAIPSHSEGRCATYRRGAGMRWTWIARLTRAPEADGEVVGFRHPQAGVKFLRNKFLRGDGGKSAGLTEESTYKP